VSACRLLAVEGSGSPETVHDGEDEIVHEEPQGPPADRPDPGIAPPVFEPPHPNGAVHAVPDRRRHAPWEFVILALLVMLIGVGIILGWTLVGSHSPERLDDASASAVAAACNRAQAALKALPNPDPRLGADRVERLRAENKVLLQMLTEFAAVHPRSSTPATALQRWSADWGRMIDARARYADDLHRVAGTTERVRFIYPAVNGITPVTEQMDDYVRENHPHLDACFTAALQLEQYEFKRVYQKVTS
jgi:hypothetical protein